MATNWDDTKPADTDVISNSADDLRKNFAAAEDALAREHNFPGNEGSDAGRHTVVRVVDQGSDPAATAGYNTIYAKSGILYSRDSSGNVRRLTPGSALAYLSADQTVSSGSPALVTFDTLTYSDGISLTSNALVVPTGVTRVRIEAQLLLDSTNTTFGRNIAIYKNASGTDYAGKGVDSFWAASTSNPPHMLSTRTAPLAVSAGDTFSVYFWHYAGSDKNVQGGATELTWLSMEILG